MSRFPRVSGILAAIVMSLALAPIDRALGESSFDIRSVHSGNWSNGTTWRPQRVPRAGDRVLVTSGTRVVYDVASSEVIRSIWVAGTLEFARDRNTRLEVGLVRVQPGDPEDDGTGVEDVEENHAHAHDHGTGAALEVGTPDRPIPPQHTARIRLHYLEGMDRDNTPAIVCRPGGRMEFHGARMSRTWLDLGADAQEGDRTLHLASAVSGWAAGDEIIVTASKRRSGARGSFRQGGDAVATEERRIESIDGDTITLDRPLEHLHSGNGRYRSEVANLSRNVIVESADPDGVRGHTMFHRYSAGGIGYARFAHLGKEGVLGRYSIHFHRVRDTLRGASVVGAAIVDSHNRWITIHGTDYLVVRDCVGYQSVGHGFFLEDGTETYNVLDRNLGVQAFRGRRLPNQELPFDPNDGAAFWWANGKNTFVRNTSAENDEYGYRYDSQKRSNFDSVRPVRSPSGEAKRLDIRTIPVFRFEGNEAHSEGLYGMVFAGTEGAGPDTRHPHRLRDLRIWEVHYGLRAQLPTMLVERLEIDHAAYGIYRPWFENHVYRDLTIAHTNTEPFNRGLDDRSTQHGKITVDGLTFAGFRGSGNMPLIQISANNASGTASSHFRNVRLENRRDGDRRPLVNLGGGPRRDPETDAPVPVYIHDWFGPGRHAEVASTRARKLPAPREEYREVPLLTGDESRAREVTDVPFPELLQPVDDEPPATTITYPRAGIPVVVRDGVLEVRGTTTDDVDTAHVLVNGEEAESLELDHHVWRARLEGIEPGELRIEAVGIDAAGNRELTPHRIIVTVESDGKVERF